MSLESCASLFLETSTLSPKNHNNQRKHISIANATGFIATTPNGIDCLITNRHVVTALNSQNKNLYEHSLLPSDLTFYLMAHDGANFLRYWHPFSMHLFKITRDELFSSHYEPLYLESDRVWVEHPILKNNADFVAIPIHPSFLESLNKNRYSLYQQTNFNFVSLKNLGGNILTEEVSDKVDVVGFPFGLTVSEFESHWHKEYSPIWISGYIASEPSINIGSAPVFLIDSRTREGNSGSPVYLTKEINGTKYRIFLGIYSGRIYKESDIGKVWKRSAIQELLVYVDNLSLQNKINYPLIEPIARFATNNESFIYKIIGDESFPLLKELFHFKNTFQYDYFFECEEVRKNKWFFYTNIPKYNLIGINKLHESCAIDLDNIEINFNIANLPFDMIKEINNLSTEQELSIYLNTNLNLKNKLNQYHEWCKQHGYNNWIENNYLTMIV